MTVKELEEIITKDINEKYHCNICKDVYSVKDDHFFCKRCSRNNKIDNLIDGRDK